MYAAQIAKAISVHLTPLAQNSQVSLPAVRDHQNPIMQVIAAEKRKVPTYRDNLLCPMRETDSTRAVRPARG